MKNFHHALAAYNTEEIAGLIFGLKDEQVITNVIFTGDIDELDVRRKEIETFFSPGKVVWNGLKQAGQESTRISRRVMAHLNGVPLHPPPPHKNNKIK